MIILHALQTVYIYIYICDILVNITLSMCTQFVQCNANLVLFYIKVDPFSGFSPRTFITSDLHNNPMFSLRNIHI